MTLNKYVSKSHCAYLVKYANLTFQKVKLYSEIMYQIFQVLIYEGYLDNFIKHSARIQMTLLKRN